ncbi:hypothetical protein KIW84_033737 [Lathyrus oleraceus]|uniref:Uncharacterized protein n=1 Tax=Pisum sativum TaxID=3888 RepID=A0A9D5AYD9_PEA|nr:hypothetical protein KIW84_033737 [Pisum sativum]
MPSNQSGWSKKFDEIKNKVKTLPAFKRFIKYTDPVKTKSQGVCSTPEFASALLKNVGVQCAFHVSSESSFIGLVFYMNEIGR